MNDFLFFMNVSMISPFNIYHALPCQHLYIPIDIHKHKPNNNKHLYMAHHINHRPIWGLNLHKLDNIDNLLWKIPFESPPKMNTLVLRQYDQ